MVVVGLGHVQNYPKQGGPIVLHFFGRGSDGCIKDIVGESLLLELSLQITSNTLFDGLLLFADELFRFRLFAVLDNSWMKL